MNNLHNDIKPVVAKPSIALLVDAENINNVSSINDVIHQLERDGEIVAKRAVGDWTRTLRLVQTGMEDLGFQIVHQKNLAPGHNSADVRLVIEAIDLLHNPAVPIDSFAVVSSDQDFLPLYDRLRELGKTVIVAGDTSVNFTRIEEHADTFIAIDDAQQLEITAVYQKSRVRRTKRGGVKVSRFRMSKKSRTEVKHLILRSMRVSMNDRGVASATNLYRTMRRLDPNFSVKRLGHARFDQLIRKFNDIVAVRGKKSANITIKLRPHLLHKLLRYSDTKQT